MVVILLYHLSSASLISGYRNFAYAAKFDMIPLTPKWPHLINNIKEFSIYRRIYDHYKKIA
jgi:hypothetical protein